MSSRVGTRGSETKNAYANFLLNDGSSLREANLFSLEKSKSLRVGDKVCIKYIYANNIFYKKYIVDVKKLD